MTVLDDVHNWFGEEIFHDGILTESRSCFVTIKQNSLLKAVKIFSEQGITHISMITALDVGGEFELKYHFSWTKEKGSAYKIVIIIQCPKDMPIIPSITTIFPGARSYEQEVHEMLGIQFQGLDSQKLLLPDNWPDRVFPLQKKWSVEKLRESIKKNE